MTKQDSRAAFEQWWDDNAKRLKYTRAHCALLAWQAALAYATSQQAERDKRVAALLDDVQRTIASNMRKTNWASLASLNQRVAAFNAQEQGR